MKKIDVDADVSGAIKEAWEGNVLRGKAKVDQFGHIILSFKDETLRLKAYELYTKCLKDYLDTFSRGQHSQTSKQQKTAYDFNGCWQADDTQDKRFIEAKSDKIFKVWTYNSYGKPYACLGEEVEVHVDASNHVVMKRRECPESDDRMTEAYFEKDDVLRIVRTIQRNGAQKSQGQRLIRLLRPEECPQSPPATQQSPPKVSLRNVDTERYIWVVYLGALCEKEQWRVIIHRTQRCDLSLFQLGLRFLEYLLNEELPIPVQFYVTI